MRHEKAVKYFEYGDIGYAYKPNTDSVKAASLMKVSQYMAMGVVPLVSDVGDLGTYVKDGEAGYICKPDDSRALANMLIRAIGDDNERLLKAEAASIRALEAYDWKKLATSVDKFLDRQYENNK